VKLWKKAKIKEENNIKTEDIIKYIPKTKSNKI
jgi:hypothetical protein